MEPAMENAKTTSTGEKLAGRDKSGRFLPGHKGIGGRPPDAENSLARQIVLSGSPEEWQALHNVIWESATKDRNAQHARLILEYNFAKPGENPIPPPNVSQTVNIVANQSGIAIDATEPNGDMQALADLIAQRTATMKDIRGRESSTDCT